MKYKKDHKLPNTKNVRKKNGTTASAAVLKSRKQNQSQSQQNIAASPDQKYLLAL